MPLLAAATVIAAVGVDDGVPGRAGAAVGEGVDTLVFIYQQRLAEQPPPGAL
ncbi:MAG: hypothetical protein M3137_15575 [Actinomycetota bacterium]|nr:hypothetical protein [Actinomycetota bacterium]